MGLKEIFIRGDGDLNLLSVIMEIVKFVHNNMERLVHFHGTFYGIRGVGRALCYHLNLNVKCNSSC